MTQLPDVLIAYAAIMAVPVAIVIGTFVIGRLRLRRRLTLMTLRFRGSPRRQRASGRIPSAQSATALVPRFNSLVDNSARLIITGGDGSYLSLDHGFFAGVLKKWAARGCIIDYVLVDYEKEFLSPFLGLASKFSNFRVHPIRIWSLRDPDLRQKAEALRTYHFALLSRNDGVRLMWIEQYHPPRSVVAYDVEFFDAEDSSTDIRFPELWNLAEELILAGHNVQRWTADPASPARIAKDPDEYKLPSDEGVMRAIGKH